MFHYFAADFPTDSTREWHKLWGNRFSGLTLLLFAGFAYVVRLLLKRKNAVRP